MHVDPERMERSAAAGARRVACALLGACDREAERLERGGEDPEALHDFRVALRRLRTILRAFRPWLSQRVRRESERRLRKLARATNVARDAEVQLAWLSAQEQVAGAPQRPGLRALRDRIARRLQASGEDRGRLRDRYARASRALARQLAGRRGHGRSGGGKSFAAILAALLGERAGALREALAKVAGAADREHLHRARIEAKRLRYVAELLRGHPRADGEEVVKRIKALQDVLGELNDSHVLAAEIEAAMADVAADRARRLHAAVYAGASGGAVRERLRSGPRPGALLPVLGLVRDRRDALYAELERTWRRGGLGALAREVRALARALNGEAGPVNRASAAGRSAPASRARSGRRTRSR